MKAIITVTGKDHVGIIAKVSAACSEHGVNIIDITQSVLSEYFAMIMLVEIDTITVPFSKFSDHLSGIGKNQALQISVMHEDIFNAMHQI